jgi:hypothetical protein
MIGFGHQQHHAAAAGTIAHLPIHAETVGNRGEAGLQRRQPHGEIGGVEHHPHEKVPGFDIVELLGVENVLSIMGQKRRDRGDDARPVRTGERENELMIGHGKTLAAMGPALSPTTALRHSCKRTR